MIDRDRRALIGTASGSLGRTVVHLSEPGGAENGEWKVDLAAATPRLANGKPDLSGVWMTGEPALRHPRRRCRSANS